MKSKHFPFKIKNQFLILFKLNNKHDSYYFKSRSWWTICSRRTCLGQTLQLWQMISRKILSIWGLPKTSTPWTEFQHLRMWNFSWIHVSSTMVARFSAAEIKGRRHPLKSREPPKLINPDLVNSSASFQMPGQMNRARWDSVNPHFNFLFWFSKSAENVVPTSISKLHTIMKL